MRWVVLFSLFSTVALSDPGKSHDLSADLHAVKQDADLKALIPGLTDAQLEHLSSEVKAIVSFLSEPSRIPSPEERAAQMRRLRAALIPFAAYINDQMEDPEAMRRTIEEVDRILSAKYPNSQLRLPGEKGIFSQFFPATAPMGDKGISAADRELLKKLPPYIFLPVREIPGLEKAHFGRMVSRERDGGIMSLSNQTGEPLYVQARFIMNDRNRKMQAPPGPKTELSEALVKRLRAAGIDPDGKARVIETSDPDYNSQTPVTAADPMKTRIPFEYSGLDTRPGEVLRANQQNAWFRRGDGHTIIQLWRKNAAGELEAIGPDDTSYEVINGTDGYGPGVFVIRPRKP